MKQYPILLIVLLLLPIVAFGQFSSSFSPQSIRVNTMALTSFDPGEPMSQPLLTQLTVNYPGSPKPRMDIKVRVYWNNYKLVEANFQNKENTAYTYPVVFSSRQLISNDGHPDFEKKPGSEDISVDDVIKANSILEDAVYAGYFPDGNMEIRIWVRNFSESSWDLPENATSDAFFRIVIRNAGSINLTSPGITLGQNPPQISTRPVSFLWNAISTGFNDQKITIREFSSTSPPTLNNVENTGSLFYENPNVLSGFSDFLPFNVGNYYAWQVSSTLFDEFNPNQLRDPNNQLTLKSNWFVFQFVDDSDASSGTEDFQAQINMLNNSILRNIFSQGYTPVGIVIYEGRTYAGQDAIDLLESLVGKVIQVQLKD